MVGEIIALSGSSAVVVGLLRRMEGREGWMDARHLVLYSVGTPNHRAWAESSAYGLLIGLGSRAAECKLTHIIGSAVLSLAFSNQLSSLCITFWNLTVSILEAVRRKDLASDRSLDIFF